MYFAQVRVSVVSLAVVCLAQLVAVQPDALLSEVTLKDGSRRLSADLVDLLFKSECVHSNTHLMRLLDA